jgi:hypothetical protein
VNKSLPFWIAWLIFSLITVGVAMLFSSAAVVDGQYIPVSNDSFYHARRIIDAATGAGGSTEKRGDRKNARVSDSAARAPPHRIA